MFATGPANNACLSMYGEPATASITTRNGMENPRTVEVMLDVKILGVVANITNLLLFGKTTAGWLFDLDTPAAGVSAATSGMSFKVTRNAAVTATTNESPTIGKRITLWGRDDQATVRALSNGAVGTTVKTYTTAEASYPITTDTNPILLGLSGANYTQLKLYEAAIRVNGILVFHVRPRIWMQTGPTPLVVPDLSGFGNDLTVSGTLNTNVRYESAWSKQMPYSGKESVG